MFPADRTVTAIGWHVASTLEMVRPNAVGHMLIAMLFRNIFRIVTQDILVQTTPDLAM
jgi:5,10-methylene-tetrahydrofolate dehydrogenase/methenyl tetrahydrofolate cyclohydrolase